MLILNIPRNSTFSKVVLLLLLCANKKLTEFLHRCDFPSIGVFCIIMEMKCRLEIIINATDNFVFFNKVCSNTDDNINFSTKYLSQVSEFSKIQLQRGRTSTNVSTASYKMYTWPVRPAKLRSATLIILGGQVYFLNFIVLRIQCTYTSGSCIFSPRNYIQTIVISCWFLDAGFMFALYISKCKDRII